MGLAMVWLLCKISDAVNFEFAVGTEEEPTTQDLNTMVPSAEFSIPTYEPPDAKLVGLETDTKLSLMTQ
jgi:hypothetical protein